MNEKTKQKLTKMLSRLQFYLESINFLTPINVLTDKQLRGTNGFNSKKCNKH